MDGIMIFIFVCVVVIIFGIICIVLDNSKYDEEFRRTEERVRKEQEIKRKEYERKQYLSFHPFILEGKTCSVMGKTCPYEHGTCGDCMIASSKIIKINSKSNMSDHCTYCGANFTKEQIKNKTITCEYCGKVHIME